MPCQNKVGKTVRSNARYNWAGMPVHKEHLRSSAAKHANVKFEKLMNLLLLVVVSKKLKEIKSIGKEYDDKHKRDARIKTGN